MIFFKEKSEVLLKDVDLIYGFLSDVLHSDQF